MSNHFSAVVAALVAAIHVLLSLPTLPLPAGEGREGET
jgi:hypothetical protein